MFDEEAAMLIRWKQGTQKVKANFENAAKTRGGKAQPGIAKRGRESCFGTRALLRSLSPEISVGCIRQRQLSHGSLYKRVVSLPGADLSAWQSQPFAPRMLRL